MICVPGGSMSHRSLCIPSDQNGAFTEYGTMPGFMR